MLFIHLIQGVLIKRLWSRFSRAREYLKFSNFLFSLLKLKIYVLCFTPLGKSAARIFEIPKRFISKYIMHVGRREIAPTWNCIHIFKNVINLFVCMKLFFFFLQFPFFIWFIPLGDIIVIKPAPGDHESNFKKVSAIVYVVYFILI